jgi:prepilin signal peptidase PulO-like enzyme (type II secretory pathway)
MLLFGVLGLVGGVLANALADYFGGSRLEQGAAEGRICPFCRRPLDLRHWLLFAATFLGFAGAWFRWAQHDRGALAAVYLLLLFTVVVIDLEHRRVPNRLMVATAVLAGSASLLMGAPPLVSMVMGGIVGLVIFLLLALLGRGALGAGDVKLAGVIGLIVGYPSVLLALIMGIFLGGIAAAILLISRKVAPHSYIPYAPYLATAAAITLLWRWG